MEAKFYINEIFYSWQGEGKNVGERAVFVRFAGCNMKDVGGRFCKFCDTKYAQLRENSTIMSLKDIFNKFSTDEFGTDRLIVFTGGEPLLYPNAISDAIALLQHQYKIQIETNGSLPFDFKYKDTFQFSSYYPITFSISPKFPPAIDHTYSLKIFETIHQIPCEYYLKFVINVNNFFSMEDKILEIMDQYSLSSEDIWLMPEGRSVGELDKNMVAVIKLASMHNFNISPRFHINYFFK